MIWERKVWDLWYVERIGGVRPSSMVPDEKCHWETVVFCSPNQRVHPAEVQMSTLKVIGCRKGILIDIPGRSSTGGK